MKTLTQVLIVEDNPADAHLVIHFLERFARATQIATVADGDQALDFLNKRGAFTSARKPDLVFLDLNLPKTDGREVLRRVKSDPNLKGIPILVFSTSNSPKDVADSYALGANAFLAKPNGLDEMDRLLNQTLVFWLQTALLS